MLPVLSNRQMRWPETGDWIDREFGRMLRQFWGNGGEPAVTAAYPVNMWEDEDAVYVEAEMPGYKRDDINITIEQGMLSIVAERQATERSNGGSIVNERQFRRYQRSFSLPASVDEDKIEARLEDGVLHLTLPKRAEVKPRRIKIN